MLSHHTSGLAVVAAPNRPAEMRSFDPDVVTRLLDLVSAHFDFVVFDMPRTWFSWTDAVLLGSNKVFIVSEATVPSLRQARQLMEAIHERLGDEAKPQVIVNRFEQKFFSPGLRRADVERAITAQLKKFILPQPNNKAAADPARSRAISPKADRSVPAARVRSATAP
jgi:pilus assembly protein CpaE